MTSLYVFWLIYKKQNNDTTKKYCFIFNWKSIHVSACAEFINIVVECPFLQVEKNAHTREKKNLLHIDLLFKKVPILYVFFSCCCCKLICYLLTFRFAFRWWCVVVSCNRDHCMQIFIAARCWSKWRSRKKAKAQATPINGH